MTNEQRIEPMLTYFGMTLEDVKGQSRKREIVLCRHFCMAILRATTPMSINNIARYFGGRDHSTIIHALRMVQTFESDWQYKYHYMRFESILSEIRAYVDPMPESIGYDEMYLNLVILEP